MGQDLSNLHVLSATFRFYSLPGRAETLARRSALTGVAGRNTVGLDSSDGERKVQMPRTGARKFNLVDAMILVAATGFSLSCYVLLDNAAFGGHRSIYHLFDQPPRGWNFRIMIYRAAAAAAMPLPLLGGWTVVLPVLGLGNSRWSRRRLGRRPGMVACLAAIAGMTVCAAVAGGALLLSWWVAGAPGGVWPRVPDLLVLYAGLSVAAVWLTQAVTGRWRRSADWLDWLGVGVGSLWLVAGLVFAMRSLY